MKLTRILMLVIVSTMLSQVHAQQRDTQGADLNKFDVEGNRVLYPLSPSQTAPMRYRHDVKTYVNNLASVINPNPKIARLLPAHDVHKLEHAIKKIKELTPDTLAIFQEIVNAFADIKKQGGLLQQGTPWSTDSLSYLQQAEALVKQVQDRSNKDGNNEN